MQIRASLRRNHFGFNAFVAIMLAIVVLGQSGMSTVASQAQSQIGYELPPPGDVIVVMNEEPFTASSGEVSVALGVEIDLEFSNVFNGFATTVNQTQLNNLARNPNVAYVAEDIPMFAAQQTPSTAISRSALTGYSQIDGGGGNANVDIAILDTGIAPHQELNIVHNQDCSGSSAGAVDTDSHGTHVSGIAAAIDDADGVAGSAPGARLWNFKVLQSSLVGQSSWIICGIDAAISQGTIEVINMSLAGSNPSASTCTSGNDPMHTAVCRATDAGILVVAAAGNGNINASSTVPAKYPSVVAVGNIADTDGAPGNDSYSSSSNYGAVVDIAAPGTSINSTIPGGGYGRKTGTSMASPLVAGVGAMYMASGGGAAAARSWFSSTASQHQSSSVGWSPPATTGSPDRILYLGGVSANYPPGTQNPSFSGNKLGIINSAATPSNEPSTYAWDNNINTNWHSGHVYPSSASLRFDLGINRGISGVKWKFAYTGYADEFTVVLVSAGGSSRTLGPFGNGASTNTFYGFAVTDGFQAQYVRFFFNNPNGDSAVGSISEVEIWGSGSNPPGTANPNFSGSKQTIVNSASTPNAVSSFWAHDGSEGTNWHSGHTYPSSASLRFDVGSNKPITGVKWKFAYPGYADEFTVVLVSAGGSSRTYGPFGSGVASQSFVGFSVPDTFQAQYVRFFFNNPNGDSAVGSISEVEIWADSASSGASLDPTFTGEKLNVDTATADLEEGLAQYLIDGALDANNWHSGHSWPTTATVTLDLGADHDVSGVKWISAYYGYADAYTIQAESSDGTITEIGAYSNPPATGAWYGVPTGSAVTAQYIRFIFTNPSNDSALGSFSEIEVWGAVIAGTAIADPLFGGVALPIVASDSPSGDSELSHDGDEETAFVASEDSPTTTVTFDLGEVRELTGVRWKAAADEILTIGTSLDGTTWSDAGVFANAPDAELWQGTDAPEGRSARYVRVEFAAFGGDGATADLSELEIWGVLPTGDADPQLEGAPLTVTCAATPENEDTSHDASKACDGNGGTNWHTEATSPATATLTLTLDAPTDLSGLRWSFAQSGNAERFNLAVSNEGIVTSLGEFSGGAANTFNGIAFTDRVTADRVILTITNIDGDSELGYLAEVEVWSTQLPTPDASPDSSPAASPQPAEPTATADDLATPDLEASPDVEVAIGDVVPEQTPAEVVLAPDDEDEASPAPAEPTATIEPTATVEPTAAISLGTIVNVDGDSINCRIAPVDGEVIITLEEGDQLDVTGGAIDGWYPVVCDGQAGFVSADFLSLGDLPVAVDPTATTESAEPPDAMATATATAEATEAPTEEPVETPYPIYDTGDTEDSGTAYMASDDDAGTYWSVYPSQSPEQTRIYFDLGSVVPIDYMTLNLAVAGMLPEFEIWLSEDAETWYNATGAINGWNLWADAAHVIDLGYDARYVRIVIPHVDQQISGEVGGIRQVEFWPAPIDETRYLTSLGDPTTPTPAPEPTDAPSEEVVPTVEPTEEFVEPTEALVEPTVEGDPGEELPPDGEGEDQEGIPLDPAG